MSAVRKAKLFRNGASQADRLPQEFRFEGDEVFIRRDEVTGEVVLSERPSINRWKEFLTLMQRLNVPDDFMADRPMNREPLDRNLFADER